jgi:phage terminase small subunit
MSEMGISEEDSMEMPSAEEMAEAMKQMQEAAQDYSEEGDEVKGGDADPEEGEQQEKMDEAMENLGEGLQSMFARMDKAHVKITATFPGKIIESNATSVEGNTATWEYKGQALMTAGVPTLTARIQP